MELLEFVSIAKVECMFSILRLFRKSRRRSRALTNPELLEVRALLADVFWTGNGANNAFNNVENWDVDRIPDSNDTVFLGSGDVVDISGESQSVQALVVNGNVELTGSAGFGIVGANQSRPALQVDGNLQVRIPSIHIQTADTRNSPVQVSGSLSLFGVTATFDAFMSGAPALNVSGTVFAADSEILVLSDRFEAPVTNLGGNVDLLSSEIQFGARLSQNSSTVQQLQLGRERAVQVRLTHSDLISDQLDIGSGDQSASIELLGISRIAQGRDPGAHAGFLRVGPSGTVSAQGQSTVFYDTVRIEGTLEVRDSATMNAPSLVSVSYLGDQPDVVPQLIVDGGYVSVGVRDTSAATPGRIDVFHDVDKSPSPFMSTVLAMFNGEITANEVYLHNWTNDPDFADGGAFRPGGVRARLRGTINGNLINDGSLEFNDFRFWEAAGDQLVAGTDPFLQVNGDYRQHASGVLSLETPVDSNQIDPGWSPMQVSGEANLSGTLRVEQRYKSLQPGQIIFGIIDSQSVTGTFIGFEGATTDLTVFNRSSVDRADQYVYDERSAARPLYRDDGVFLIAERFSESLLSERTFTASDFGMPESINDFSLEQGLLLAVTRDFNLTQGYPAHVAHDQFLRLGFTPVRDRNGAALQSGTGGSVLWQFLSPGYFDIRVKAVLQGVAYTMEWGRLEIRYPTHDEIVGQPAGFLSANPEWLPDVTEEQIALLPRQSRKIVGLMKEALELSRARAPLAVEYGFHIIADPVEGVFDIPAGGIASSQAVSWRDQSTAMYRNLLDRLEPASTISLRPVSVPDDQSHLFVSEFHTHPSSEGMTVADHAIRELFVMPRFGKNLTANEVERHILNRIVNPAYIPVGPSSLDALSAGINGGIGAAGFGVPAFVLDYRPTHARSIFSPPLEIDPGNVFRPGIDPGHPLNAPLMAWQYGVTRRRTTGLERDRAASHDMRAFDGVINDLSLIDRPAKFREPHVIRWDGSSDFPDITPAINQLGEAAALSPAAVSLDAVYDFRAAVSFFENSIDLNEKWFQSAAGNWFYITPLGQVFDSGGSEPRADDLLIASLSRVYYDKPRLLFDASLVQLLGGQLLESRRGDHFQNWGGLDEKWLAAKNGRWYIIMPDGNIARWLGGTANDLRDNLLPLIKVDESYYSDLNLIYDDLTTIETGAFGHVHEGQVFFERVQSTLSAYSFGMNSYLRLGDSAGFTTAYLIELTDELAAAVDQTHLLRFTGNYAENWGGLGEKWMRGHDGWYYLTPDADLFRWDGAGQRRLSGTFIAKLTSEYFANPQLLHEASESSLDRDLELQGNPRSDYDFNWAGLGEKWIRGKAGWYWLNEQGALYCWNGGSRSEVFQNSNVVANGLASYYENPDQLHSAHERYIGLSLGLMPAGSRGTAQNWGGLGERWVQGQDGWYYVRPDGVFYRWLGGPRADLVENSIRVTQFDESLFHDLLRLN